MTKRTGRARGGKREGAGRPAGVSNEATEKRRTETRHAIEDACRELPIPETAGAEYIVARGLYQEAKGAKNDLARVDAWKHLDNRLQGRPREALEVTGPGGCAIPFEHRVFRARLASGEEALAPPPALPPAQRQPTAAAEKDAPANS